MHLARGLHYLLTVSQRFYLDPDRPSGADLSLAPLLTDISTPGHGTSLPPPGDVRAVVGPDPRPRIHVLSHRCERHVVPQGLLSQVFLQAAKPASTLTTSHWDMRPGQHASNVLTVSLTHPSMITDLANSWEE